MDNRDIKTAFGEWLCGMLSNSIVKTGIRANIRNGYEQDYILVTNLFSGFWNTTSISQKSIDGAKEWYIQHNKSLLEISLLPDDQKREASQCIDTNAETLKQRWISAFKERGIMITQ